jgi:hypothetical protein
MDCRETGTLLIAFHDGELPENERARVEAHLQGCPACRALLAGLARADEAAGVPDPGPEYWARFNDRVMARVARDPSEPMAVVLRPKRGWVRQQLRYLVPAVAAAALVVVVVRHAGMGPGAPAPPVPAPSAPQTHEVPSSPRISSDSRSISSMQERPAAGRVAGNAAGSAASPKPPPAEAKTTPVTPIANAIRPESFPAAAPPSVPAREIARVAPTLAPATTSQDDERLAGIAKEERLERAAVGKQKSVPTQPAPAPSWAGAAAPAMAPPPPMMRSEGRADTLQESAAKARSAKEVSASPCELARRLAAQGRLKEAEAAQRACLKQSQAPAAQEDGLVFLAELLDRQTRFAEADAVIEETRLQFPGSRPLDRYMRQRPMLQRQLLPPGR